MKIMLNKEFEKQWTSLKKEKIKNKENIWILTKKITKD